MNTFDINTVITMLRNFRGEANKDEFLDFFGHLGNHLWLKWKQYDYDVIKFYSMLDLEQQRNFTSNLLKYYHTLRY